MCSIQFFALTDHVFMMQISAVLNSLLKQENAHSHLQFCVRMVDVFKTVTSASKTRTLVGSHQFITKSPSLCASMEIASNHIRNVPRLLDENFKPQLIQLTLAQMG